MSQSKSKPSKKQPNPWDWSPVDPHSVFTVSQDRKILLGGAPITENEYKRLQDEAKAFKNSRLWQVMHETVRQKAIQTGFVEAETWERTMSGKMMLHNLGVLKSIVESLTNMPAQYIATMPPKPYKPTQKVAH